MTFVETESNQEIASGLHPNRLKPLRLNWLSEYSHIDPANPTDEGYFSPIQEQYLAARIQEANKAQTLLDSDFNFDADQQAEAARIIAEGKRATQALFEVNMPFALMMARASVGIEHPYVVQKIKAKKFARIAGNAIGTYAPIARLKSPLADLEHRSMSALEGLWKATNKFEANRDAKFITFAAWYIQGQIEQDSHSEEHAGVRLPEYRHMELGAFFRDNPMMDPETMPYDIEKLLAATSYTEFPDSITNNEMSPDYGTGDDDEPDDIADRFGVPPGQGYDAELVLDLFNNDVDAVLESMASREADVIRLRYGFATGEPLTLDAAGKIVGVTRERVRQIESKTLSKMRHRSRSEIIKPYWNDTILGDLSSAVEQQYGRRGDYSTSLGRITARLTSHSPYDQERGNPPTMNEYHEQEEKKAWQAYAGEKWDLPPRATRHAKVVEVQPDGIQRIKDILTNAQLYNFQESFGKNVNTPLPVSLFNRIAIACGDKRLTQPQVDEIQVYFENNVMSSMIDTLGDDFSLERTEKLFEALHVKLRIPEQQ